MTKSSRWRGSCTPSISGSLLRWTAGLTRWASSPLVIASRQVEQRRRSYGGSLAKYLLPHVVERERSLNPNAKGAEAWAWLPPPLIGEGQKVQPAWLNDYLLDPHLIRPAVLMRMPKYNLSPVEARKLADYFAAQDNSRYPYQFAPERRDPYLAQADAQYARRLEELHRAGADRARLVICRSSLGGRDEDRDERQLLCEVSSRGRF